MARLELLTTGEAGRLLGVGSDRVRQMEREGKLSAMRTATGLRLFDRRAVERLAAERNEGFGSKGPKR
jgi:excisionase family DNA binding protein